MRLTTVILLSVLVLSPCYEADAQLRNLGKRIEKKVNDRINRKFDRGVDKGLDEVEKGVDGTVTGDGEKSSQQNGEKPASTNTTGNEPGNTANTPASSDFVVNTKFDYVPGELLMVFDDYNEDAIGDFPARWNTDGTGEVVTFGDSHEKWFQMKSGSDYIPDLPRELPEEYTIEFDLVARGLDSKTSSSTLVQVILDDNNLFRTGKNRATVSIPFCQYHHIGIRVRSDVSGINNVVEADIRSQILNQPHISIAINKTRLRMWVNETKYVDIPRLVPGGNTIKYLKFRPYYFKDGKEDIFIRNLKIAEGGLDLRAQLLKEGTVSTNGILFDVNSANIQPESYGVLRQIALALEESDMKLNIIGHTDSDGSDDNNLSLSQRRAEAVKTALVDDFGIQAPRLTVEGKGESQPVAENNSSEGKAANRRVEFVSL